MFNNFVADVIVSEKIHMTETTVENLNIFF